MFGFDISLTEIIKPKSHCFLAEIGSDIAIDIIKEEIVITEENPFYIQTTSISLVKFEREPLKIDWWLDYPLKE